MCLISYFNKIEGGCHMEFDFFWIGLGLAALGYFIGNGLTNFKKGPVAQSLMDSFDADEDHELVKENELHWYIGVTKEDAKKLIEEYPNVPHITLNGNNYYPKEKLRQWLLEIGEVNDK